MYQPAHLDSFLRLLISHLGSVLGQGEQTRQWQTREMRMELLQDAIELGENSTVYQDKISRQQDCEALFVLQMSQSREWVDRLGQLDPQVERNTDEFLAATFSIEKLLHNRSTRETDYQLENRMIGQGTNEILRDQSSSNVDIDLMTDAIFELLGRLEDHYELMEELLDVKQVVNGIPFGEKYAGSQKATVIPLFPRINKALQQDNASQASETSGVMDR